MRVRSPDAATDWTALHPHGGLIATAPALDSRAFARPLSRGRDARYSHRSRAGSRPWPRIDRRHRALSLVRSERGRGDGCVAGLVAVRGAMTPWIGGFGTRWPTGRRWLRLGSRLQAHRSRAVAGVDESAFWFEYWPLRAHLGPFLRGPEDVLPGHNGLSNVRLPPLLSESQRLSW